MILLKGILLIASLTGYCCFIKAKTGIRKEFIPLAVFSSLSLLLFAGGLADLLFMTAAAIYFVGLLLCFYTVYLIKKKKISLGKPGLFEFCFLFTGAFFLILSLFLKLQHYDNFSHWALVVKHMLTTDRYPAVQDSIISFKDYPPGASLFLYYVSRFWGNSQGILLAGQNLLLLSGFLAIFGIVREKKRFLVYSFIAMGCSMLSYLNLTIRINNLLVDFHMPIFALAAVAAADYYRDNLKKTACILIPVLGFLTIIKSTGMIFAAFPALYLIFLLIKSRQLHRKAGYPVLILFLSALPFLLWNHHINTDLNGIEKKFSTDSESEEYAALDPSQYSEVTEKFTEAAADTSSRAAAVFYLCQAGILPVSLWFLFVKKRRLKLFAALLSLDFVVILYYLGILFLYLYRMPVQEAAVLAGFERYACSIMVFFAGGLVLAGAKDIENSFYIKNVQGDTSRAFYSPNSKQRYQTAVLVTSILLFNFLYSEITGLAEIRSQYPQSIAGRIESVTGDYWADDRKEKTERYLVISTEKQEISSYELSYTMKYFLYDDNVTVTAPVTAEELTERLADYDLVIFLNEGTLLGNQETESLIDQKRIWDSSELRERLRGIGSAS